MKVRKLTAIINRKIAAKKDVVQLYADRMRSALREMVLERHRLRIMARR